MNIDTCSWDHPGVNPYSGTPTAAIMAFVQIPKAVRVVLAARAERGTDYDDVVYIDRDSIKSVRVMGGSYEPTLRNMHFGNAGKVCGNVTRNWKIDHVESAMVFCEGDWCVARPSVCNNWSMVARTQRSDAPFGLVPMLPVPAVVPEVGDFSDGPPGAGVSSDAGLATALSAPFYGGGFASAGAGGFAGGWGGAGICETCCVPAAPVPEPATWLLFIAGLVAVGAHRQKRKNRAANLG